MNDWIESATRYIELWLDYQLETAYLPGCSFALTCGDEYRREKSWGITDITAKTLLTPRSRFRVASLSKTFTAAGMMKLIEQKKLQLDCTLGDFLDGLHKDVSGITVQQLLSHTSGLSRDGLDSSYFADKRNFLSKTEVLNQLKMPLTIKAGLRTKYSNIAFSALGLVIEAVSGDSYNDWITREVIDAAGLKETSADIKGNRDSLVPGHNSSMPTNHRHIIPGDNLTFAMSPATGFVSTAADIAKFFSQLSPSSTKSFLMKASRKQMIETCEADCDSTDDRHYGLGIHSGEIHGWRYFGNIGRFQGYYSRVIVIPEYQISFSLLINAIDAIDHHLDEHILSILQQFQKFGAAPKENHIWFGRWWNLWGPMDTVPIGNKIFLTRPNVKPPFYNASIVELQKKDTGIITQAPAMDHYGERARLLRNSQGIVSGLQVGGGRFGSMKLVSEDINKKYLSITQF